MWHFCQEIGRSEVLRLINKFGNTKERQKGEDTVRPLEGGRCGHMRSNDPTIRFDAF
jgi:hypothetical protein